MYSPLLMPCFIIRAWAVIGLFFFLYLQQTINFTIKIFTQFYNQIRINPLKIIPTVSVKIASLQI